ncbi:MAG: CHAT domain-containing protein [Acetobacteraceae bacterium]
MRALLAAGLLLASLAGCTEPPSEAFVGGSARRSAVALDLGTNTAGETCSLQSSGAEADVHCGTYVDAAGHVARIAGATSLQDLVTASPWRRGFQQRFVCAPPTPVTVAGQPALALSCTRRQGGWPHVVVATGIDGALYVADGIGPVQSVLPQAIAVMAGKAQASPVESVERRGLATQREAARAETTDGAGAIAEAEFQVSRGALENRRGNYAAAEAAYRAAITIQERMIGGDNPALATGLARLALQISNQGRFAEADALYVRAERLAGLPNQIDPVARPLVAHLKALNDLNAGRARQALALLDQAEAGYAPLVPRDALVAQRQAGRTGRGAVEEMADQAAESAMLANQVVADALNGLIETRRYRAVALSELGRHAEAETALQAARSLYAGRDPRLVARYLRTAGVASASVGRNTLALAELGAATRTFARVQPNSLPLAETQLLQAAELVGLGRGDSALPLCRSATAILRDLNAGIAPDMLTACLQALEAGGTADLPDMFMLSQLGQGSITARQIARATARLAEGARDPRVLDAIRQRDRIAARLDALYARRAQLAAETDRGAAVSEIDAEIRSSLDARREAGQALQAAAPRFAGLVQETVALNEVQATLAPDEAVAAITLGDDRGWTFLIRAHAVTVGRIEGGSRRIDPLVRRIRASMVLGPDNRPPAFDAAAARELHTALFGGVAPAMADVTQLTVAPSGSLLSLPFGLLLTGSAQKADNSAPFLIRRVALSHVPSVGGFVNLRRSARTVTASRPWFGMGDYRPPTPNQAAATFPADSCGESARLLTMLPPLPAARRELDAARIVLGADPSDQILGSAFTARNVLAAPLRSHRILHFATHAVLPGELRCQAEPAILTSTPPDARSAAGALLTASQIEQMELDAELVILAACNTAGPGGSGAGESLSGLARSFFFAGARSLLVTHWDANDVTTTYLTVLFLQRLSSNPGAGPAAALAATQRRMLDEAVGARAGQAHPYYWAVTALIGGTPQGAAPRQQAERNNQKGDMIRF